MATGFKLVLVPTDFSPAASSALRTAVNVARAFSATIELFHVDIDPSIEGQAPENPFPVRLIFQSIHAETVKRLGRLADEVRKAGVPCMTVSGFGRSSRAIVEQARASNADLIVIGHHSDHRIGHLWLGSLTRSIVEHAPCALLVVPYLEAAVRAQGPEAPG